MFAVAIWLLEFRLFGANLPIVLSFSVIAECSQFRGANSLLILSLECGVFEACFIINSKPQILRIQILRAAKSV